VTVVSREKNPVVGLVPRRRQPAPSAVLLADGSIGVEGARILSPREAEVIEAVAAGSRSWEIAEELGISRDAVDKCIQRVLETNGLRNRAALAAWWVELTMDLYSSSAAGSGDRQGAQRGQQALQSRQRSG
jgi:DNA-binding CsgD family transcriptional regulator